MRLKAFVLIAAMILCPVTQALETGRERLEGTLGPQLGGLAAMIFFHEAAHGVVAWSLGSEVLHFKPYPHTINGQLVLGSVRHELRPRGEETEKDLYSKRAWISASGSLTTMLMSMAVAPLIPQTKDDTMASFLYNFSDWALVDWPAYVTGDIIMSKLFKKTRLGDWKNVSRYSGVPIYFWLVASYATAWAVHSHNQHFVDQAIDEHNQANGITSAVYAPVFAAKWHF